MNRNISTILFLILILASVFAGPIISSITTTTADGSYKAGEIIQIKVTFNEDVNVNSATLTLNTNATAAYIGVSGAVLDFNYTVGSNQNTNNLEVSSLTGSIISAADGNAATLTISTNLVSSIVIDTNAPVCSITSPLSDFNSTAGKEFHFNCSGASSTPKATINGIEVSEGNLLTWITANVIYTILIDANDSVGNNSKTTSTFNYDTTAPTGTFTANDYSNSNPQLTFNSSDAITILLSCSETGPWYSHDYNTTLNTLDITSNLYGCSDNTENGDSVYVYAKFIDKAGNLSNQYRQTIIYDSDDPNFDKADFIVTPGDKEIVITWDNPHKPLELATVQATAYLDSTLKKDTTKAVDKEEITLTGLSNGSDYDIDLKLTDSAGNTKTLSYNNITPRAITVSIKLTPSVTYAKSGDTITAKCTFSNDTTGDALLELKYTYPNTDKEELDSANDTTSLEGSITITDTKHDGIYFYCSSDQSGSVDAFVRIDNNKPFIEWKDTNNLFIGMKRVTVKASDNLSLSKVEIDFNNSINAITSKDTNNNYYLDLNTAKYENGTYVLKATATDEAGNKTEITRTVTLDNYLSPKQLAEKAINEAKAKQKTSADLINYYKAQALVIPADLNTNKTDGDTLITQAISELNSQPDKAKTDAINAAKLFDEFNTKATTQVKETISYTSDLNGSIEILKTYGLSAEEAANQISTMKDTGITRKLIIVQTGTSNKRQVKIELSFKNDTNSNIVKIVEVIPKELVEMARNIVSDANFRIIKNDPIIEFTVPVAKGATTTISYGIGEMDSIKAQEIVDKNVIALFETAPIVLDGNLTIESSLKNLNNGNEFLLLIIGVLIILIIIAVSLFFVRFKMPGHGFGEEKTLIEHITPEEKEAKKKFEAFKK